MRWAKYWVAMLKYKYELAKLSSTTDPAITGEDSHSDQVKAKFKQLEIKVKKCADVTYEKCENYS